MVASAGARSLLEELARADEMYGEALRELDGLAERTAALRQRASELSAFLAAAPAERDRLEVALKEAEGDEVDRRASLAEAEAELAEAERRNDEERLLAARRFHVRAKDALRMAEKRVRDTYGERERLESGIAAAEAEIPELEGRAATLAGSLRGRPRVAVEAGRVPGPGLAGAAEWASGARAALLVARSGVAAERDALIRQASELGSVVLGEVIVASSVAAVATRVGRALDD
jgi:hypothetical protein